MAAIRKVIILGGGLAGLAAAACLAEAHFSVELIEKRPVLGGRASSFFPPGESERIDNCQHVLLGCCTNLLDFFRRSGTENRFRFYDSYLFLGPRGASTMSASFLPAPLHLLPSLLRFKDLEVRDIWAIAQAMRTILRTSESAPDELMMGWLQRQRQTGPAIENFWRVVLTSALNEDLERLSSRHAFKVFRDGFMRHRDAFRMGVPAIPLTELYGGRFLAESCSLRLGTIAGGIEFTGDAVRSIRLRDGEELTADYFISTLPPDSFRNLLNGQVADAWPEIDKLAGLGWSPITGVHLWFDKPITALEHAAIVGRTIQWVFNRSAIGEAANPAAGGQYLQIVVSASRSFMNMRREEILELVLGELRELFPESRTAALLNAVVVKESKATLSPQPGIDDLRPAAATNFKNLFLGGDWVSTGWPFTMEGAVRSGYRAAELVTEAAGSAQRFLKPDLPMSRLMRLLTKTSRA